MRTLIVLTVLFALSTPGHAITINIPADFPTIQNGIDAALNGDVVLVAAGIYQENIDFLGKAITVRSARGPYATVIDGNGNGSVVTFNSGEGLNSILEGFTLTGGSGTYTPPSKRLGGGIYCELSSPTISCNVIVGNAVPGSPGSGGGVYCVDASPLIINNTVGDNFASSNGGGLHFYGGLPQAFNNTITRNGAGLGGGGLFCRNTTCDISNTIFWNNTATSGPELALIFSGGASILNISYSDVEGGQSSAYVEPGCTLNWGIGMIDADPVFVDPINYDFHLTFNSSCRDSGDNSTVTTLYDFEGDTRIAWGGTVDMGSDEFYTHLYITGYKTPGGRIQCKLVGQPSTTPVALFIGSGVRPAPAPTAYGDFWLLPPKILIPLIPIPMNGVLNLSATVPPTPSAPYDVPAQALIGLNSDSLTNLYVLEIR